MEKYNQIMQLFYTLLTACTIIFLYGCKDSPSDPPPSGTEECPEQLVHFWKFEEAVAPFSDLQGNNTLTNITSQKTGGRIGEGIRINNQEKYNTLYDSTFNWPSDSGFTIEFWMRDSALSAGNEVIIGRDDGTNTPGHDVHWWIGIQGDGRASFNLRDNNRNGGSVSGNRVVSDGNWHHIAAVRDQETNENYLYVDGQKEGEFAFNFTSDFSALNTPVNVGYLNLAPFYFYTGDLDELAVYNSALTPAEIQRHYQNGSNGKNYCQQ